MSKPSSNPSLTAWQFGELLHPVQIFIHIQISLEPPLLHVLFLKEYSFTDQIYSEQL